MAEPAKIIQPELLEVPEPPAPNIDFFVVIAHWKANGQDHWRIFPDLWLERERAIKAAQRLGSGWINRRIAHIKIAEG